MDLGQNGQDKTEDTSLCLSCLWPKDTLLHMVVCDDWADIFDVKKYSMLSVLPLTSVIVQ